VENLVLILVVLTSISILLQIVFLVAAFFRVRQISDNVERLSRGFEERTTPLLVELKETVGDTRELLKTIQVSAENFRGISESVKSQVEKVNAAIEDASTRARNQIAKVDGVISDAVLRVEATTLIIQQSVLTPIREMSALIRGVSSGLQFLLGNKKNRVNEVHQDEELFI
jgi:uncharacterized protein YoxC